MTAEARFLTVDHPRLGLLRLEDTIGAGGPTIVRRGLDQGGRSYAVKLGRPRGEPRKGAAGAYGFRREGGPIAKKRGLSRSVIDGALIAEAVRLETDGASYHVASHGVGSWLDPSLGVYRPALVLDEIQGRTLRELDPESWLEEAWHIVSRLLVMVMVTPRGESTPHRDIKADNVILGQDNQLHLIDPGVEFCRADLAHVAGFDLRDTLGDEPWPDDEVVCVTTFDYYPTHPPSTPGADLQALGLMVYEGVTGRYALDRGSPAPSSYNYGQGRYGRGVQSPKIVIGDIPRPSKINARITRQMEEVVMYLLRAPFGHDLALGRGRTMADWAGLCHAAAESMR